MSSDFHRRNAIDWDTFTYPHRPPPLLTKAMVERLGLEVSDGELEMTAEQLGWLRYPLPDRILCDDFGSCLPFIRDIIQHDPASGREVSALYRQIAGYHVLRLSAVERDK